MEGRLRVVYMGTPDFAVPPLKAMAESEICDVVLVVTQPDKARDRGKHEQPTPVKAAAAEAGIPVSQPVKIRGNSEFIDELRELAPDMIVVAAYGQILPPEVLDIPRLGCVNIHASLLPRFRGAAPIQHSILAGDKETGITLMFMAEGLDTGDMIAKSKVSIGNKNADELHDVLSEMGADLLMEYIPRIADGDIAPEKQNDSGSCYAPMISKKDGEIDFSKDAAYIDRQVRAMGAWPGTYTYLNGVQMKVKSAEVANGGTIGNIPGTVVSEGKDGIIVACGRGMVVIKEIQMPGKRRMTVDEFLRGNSVELGTILGKVEDTDGEQ